MKKSTEKDEKNIISVQKIFVWVEDILCILYINAIISKMCSHNFCFIMFPISTIWCIKTRKTPSESEIILIINKKKNKNMEK